MKNPSDSSPDINTKLTPTKSISRSQSQARGRNADQSVSRSRSQARPADTNHQPRSQSRPADTSVSRSRSQARSNDHPVSRSKSQMRPRNGSDHHSPHTQAKLVNLTDESIFTQGSLLARRESEKGSSFLKHDPSVKSTKSNVTRKRSGTVNSISNYPTSRSR